MSRHGFPAFSSIAAVAALFLPSAKASPPDASAGPSVAHPALHREDREGVRWGALPIANYTSDQGMTLGALGQRFDYGAGVLPFQSLLTAQLSFAQRGPKLLFLSYEQTQVGEQEWRLRSDLTLFDNSSQRYYGLGPQTQRLRPADAQGLYSYRLRQATGELSARRALALSAGEPANGHASTTPQGFHLQVGLGAQAYSATSQNSASVFAADYGPESEAVFGYGFARVILERRDSEFIPSQGHLAVVGFRFSPGLSDRLGVWSRFDLDLRKYYPFLDQRWLWLATQLRYSAASSAAPLQEKARLGSLGTVRGYALNRYIDSQALSARAELRSVTLRMHVFDLPLKVGQGLFADAGRVGSSLAAIGRAPTAFTWGVTLFGSYFTDDFLGSADIGFAPEGAQFYFGLGYAF